MQVLCLSEMILLIFQTTAKNYIPQQSKTKPSNAIHAASDNNYLSQSLSLLLEHDENEPNVLQKRGQAHVNMNLFNLLKTERRPLYFKAQSVPRCKQFSSRL
jgi:hypothetical protein